ncbi:MAG: hypothetical protein BWY76_01112 [bacterium ADurb.Bin429]|nr:MAG: hypothetical protein BWY76_01112 [bacterium ADurb.Bin429]
MSEVRRRTLLFTFTVTSDMLEPGSSAAESTWPTGTPDTCTAAPAAMLCARGKRIMNL